MAAAQGWHPRRPNRAYVWVVTAVYLAAFAVFLTRALPIYGASHRILAWLVFSLGSFPMLRYLFLPRGVPLVQLVLLQYALFFGMPVFFEGGLRIVAGITRVDPMAIEVTLMCAALAVAAISAGYLIAGRAITFRFRMFRFEPDPDRLFWYGIASIVGWLISGGAVETLLGAGAAASLGRPLGIIFSSDLGIAILASLYYLRKLSRARTVIAVSLLLGTMAVGFTGGMFQNVAQPFVIWLICGWVIRRRPPVYGLLAVVFAFFLLQPVKGVYRSQVWMQAQTLTMLRKADVYGTLIVRHWSASGDDSERLLRQTRESAAERLSLLLRTARFVELTPSKIDYKQGSTLAYLVYGWIPRAVWPDKPTAQVANRTLPVEYGLQAQSSTRNTMYGVGHVAETYVNFGLVGIVPVFLLLGFAYRIPQLLVGSYPTAASLAVCVACAVAMMQIGSTVGEAVGGFIQQIVVQSLLLRVFTRRHELARSRPLRRPLAVR